jgi:hypothetical protein
MLQGAESFGLNLMRSVKVPLCIIGLVWFSEMFFENTGAFHKLSKTDLSIKIWLFKLALRISLFVKKHYWQCETGPSLKLLFEIILENHSVGQYPKIEAVGCPLVAD